MLTPTTHTLLAEGRGDSNHRKKKAFKRSSRSSFENLNEKKLTPKTWIPSSIRNYIVEGIEVLLENAPGIDISGLLCLNVTSFLKKEHFSGMQYSGSHVWWSVRVQLLLKLFFFSHSKNPRVTFCRGWCHAKAKEAGVRQGTLES